MSKFKIGDKIKLRKLLEKEFYKIYFNKHMWNWKFIDYKDYLNTYEKCFNQIYEVEKIISGFVFTKKHKYLFCIEEVKKISYLKTKYKIVKELLKNE